MAIYHLSMKIISRNSGYSAVASAAYRSGSLMLDERTGLTHDYTRKSGVAEAVILISSFDVQRKLISSFIISQ